MRKLRVGCKVKWISNSENIKGMEFQGVVLNIFKTPVGGNRLNVKKVARIKVESKKYLDYAKRTTTCISLNNLTVI